MSALTVLILLAVAGAMFALASGVWAMARDGEVAHCDSVHWMAWRVAFQGLALALILLAAALGFH
jgi:hypothetical protein